MTSSPPPLLASRIFAQNRPLCSTGASHYKLVPHSLDIPLLTRQLKDRKVAKLVLPNGIKGVVISDTESPVTGAALSVEAGSWMDGRHDGTAHFLEHMLFLGTKKYPNEHDYERFIYDSNGQLNGYTASDHSLYYFTSVTPSAFDGALDRFSRFFYEPLFNDSCVEREMNAVDQEFRKNMEQDGWRVLHVRKELANPAHPFSGFNTGNLETMKLIEQETLHTWFHNHYSANLMHFAVLGRDSVEQLAEKAELAFGPIKNHNLPTLSTANTRVFPESLHRTLTWIEPIKNLRELTLAWEIPFKYNDAAAKPAKLAAHVLGYEGKNSILSMLKREELAEGLSAGKSHLGADNLLFEISVSLTEKGVRDWRDVVGRIFQAIASLQKETYPKHLFDEVNFMNKIAYQYQQRNSGIATQWCGLLRKEGIDTFPRQSYFIEQFDQEAVQSLLGEFTPDTCMYTMIAQEAQIDLNKTEKWMGAKYGLQSIQSEVEGWRDAQPLDTIQYPKANAYIPQDLKMTKRNNDPPQLLLDAEPGKLYHFPDEEFAVPESAYIFNMKTPKIRPGNARSVVLAALYTRFVHERLTELSYDAASAGLHYDVSVSSDTGIRFIVDGYSEKAQLLLKSVLERLQNPSITLNEFTIYKESLERSYKNAAKESPLRQAMDKLSAVIYDQYCTPAMLADAVQTVKIDDLEQFSKSLFDMRYIEAFVGGNVTAEEATSAWDLVKTHLSGSPCSPDLVVKSKVLPFPNTRPAYHSTATPVKGNAIVWAVGLGERDHWLRTGQELMTKLMKEPFYTELRTKQQTGYIVSSGGFQADKQLFVQAAVQSNSHDPRDLLARIELFQETFLRDLAESKDIEERFESVKSATLARLRQPYDTLGSKLRFFNYLAYEESANFDMLAQRLAVMEAYTLADLRQFAEEALGRDNKRRVAVLATGNSPENLLFSYESCASPDALKNRSKL
ncbi:hypothetical protein PhCBS80983_g03070 [Powellomyces hirtus]|uniref:Pitrilysin n=1 Tax=Powellomyces hirtus TaxID=109895 RepID=A0A507E601_9FUNG|nr:hypothetical protein PhCBS80983_g03070 [Powellomyces hirtus]